MAQQGAGGRTTSRSSRDRKGGGSIPAAPKKPFTSPRQTQAAPTMRSTPATKPKPTAPLKSRTVAPKAPPTTSRPFGGGGGGSVGPISSAPFGGGGGGGVEPGGDLGMAAAAAPAISDEDFLAGDSGYQAQMAALMRALQDYQTDDTAQRTKYDTDYGEATKNLGWMDPDGIQGAQAGKWNLEDTNTASGRGYQNQMNDFASRGMLQSSLYGEANDNFMRSLNDQLGSMNTGRTDFFSDRERELGSFKNENTLNTQQARAEALARRAAGLMI